MHYLIGDLGHLGVILLFTAGLFSALAYFFAARLRLTNNNLDQANSWTLMGRLLYLVASLAALWVIVALFIIIYNHYFEYHYAWAHSSRALAPHYMISCFWEGQEGSFLLWIFWNALVGLWVIKVNKAWEPSVMAVFALVQAFLASMILGVDAGIFNLGSSPFILMRDAVTDAPIFSMNPEYVPEDGTGLNPLLQNPWMVIHPPTVFFGFALTLVPFSFAIAGIWQRKYHEWIRPALPWVLVGTVVMTAGLVMGAIWAYETLNFGGYWNWDPVENAVYIPWLILIATLHLMISYKQSGRALRSSLLFAILTFLLVLYATFLTRSGVLGESSVHSFTDLGLSGQLVLYLVSFTAIAAFLLIKNWKKIPHQKHEASAYSKEFWMFVGVLVISLASFQVFLPTSIPVLNSLLGLVGIESNMAPPADPIAFYTQWQMWLAIPIAVLSGITQFFWWKKIDKTNIGKLLYAPGVVSLLLSAVGIVSLHINKPQYILLFTASVFAVVANLFLLVRFIQNKNLKLSGGALAHIGVGIMLIGILFSAGYDKIISLNNTGRIYSKQFSDDLNRDNTLLWRNEPKQMGHYNLTYLGPRMEVKGVPEYVKKEAFWRLNETQAIARININANGQTYFKKGDTLQLVPENAYYEIQFEPQNAEPFTLMPRAQINPAMGGLLASPDLRHKWLSDLYVHVSSIPPDDEEKQWTTLPDILTQPGDTFMIGDHFARFDSLIQVKDIDGLPVAENDFVVRAKVIVFGKRKNHVVYPTMVIRGQNIGRLPAVVEDLGLRITLNKIEPKTETFTFGVSNAERDWVILKAVEKPLINLLWIGAIITCIGTGMAAFRRFGEFGKVRDKNTEF